MHIFLQSHKSSSQVRTHTSGGGLTLRMIEIENQSGLRADSLGQNKGDGNEGDDNGDNNGIGDTLTVTKLKDVGEKSSNEIALKTMSYYVDIVLRAKEGVGLVI